MYLKLLFCIISIVCYTGIYCQSIPLRWYFGHSAGVYFNNGIPEIDTNSSLYAIEGVASLTDHDGNILFYTDGEFVYDRNHQQMPNGFGLFGLGSSTQSSLIIPHPGMDSVYFLFTTSQPASGFDSLRFRYTLVDMKLNGGLGDVVDSTKNILISLNSTERLGAVPSTSFDGYWVFSVQNFDTKIEAYRVDSNGVDLTPVVSDFYTDIPYSIYSFSGYMSISPNLKYLASSFNHSFGLFEINRNSGSLSQIGNFPNDSIQFSHYGICFSPSSKRLYVRGNIIVQYDLEQLPDTIAFNNSADTIGDNWVGGAIQIAPDGKIYGAVQNQPYLIAINDPNQLGSACNIEDSAIFLFRNSRLGLPSFSFLDPWIDTEINCINDSSFFTYIGGYMDSIQWDFGDPGSGSLNVSDHVNASHVYTDSGLFKVTLKIFKNGSFETLETEFYIKPNPVLPVLSASKLCPSDSVEILGDSTLFTYLWSTGSNNSFLIVTDTGNYSVTVSNGCDNISDTFYFSIDSVSLNITYDSILCEGVPIDLITQTDSTSRLLWWNNDSKSSSQTIEFSDFPEEDSITIWVQAYNSCDTLRDSLLIQLFPAPNLDFFSDDLLCDMENAFIAPVLDDRVEYTLLLQNDFGNFDTVFPWSIAEPGLYRMVAQNHCDTISREHPFSPYNIIEIDLPSDTVVCPADLLILDATWPGSSYLWESTALDSVVTDSALAIESEAVYTVTITNPPCTRVEDVSVVFDESLCDSVACKFEVSNVITPNGDGVNDLWRVSNACDLSYEVFVYNRWGQLVYNTSSVGDDEYADQSLTGTKTHPLTSASGRTGSSREGEVQRSIGWDGRVNGEAINDGVYFYLISYDGGNRSQKGSITVIGE